MEDVLGGKTDLQRFGKFLSNWDSVLARRVGEASARFAAIDGVCGLILAGSLGRNEAWPLSDIDMLPIYCDGHVEIAAGEIERHRIEFLHRWVQEGWWTGLDIGRLYFTQDELIEVLDKSESCIPALLENDRWYHSLDKGYRGQAIYDPTGLAGSLAGWFTRHRFDPAAVQFRLIRARQEVTTGFQQFQGRIDEDDPLGATIAIRAAAKWLQTWQLEQWGERDISLGRVGKRFELLALERGRPELVTALRVLNDLEDEAVQHRMTAAPDWVWERHDRSLRARRFVGEQVSQVEDARDTLRVCSHYEMRRPHVPPFPSWLGIETDRTALERQVDGLAALMERCFSDTSD
jgi:hypothetical protein